MSIDEAIAKLDQLIAAYDTELSHISEEAALSAKALIVHHIQTEGIGKTYSTNKIPAFLFLLDESRLDTQQTIAFVKSVEDAPKPEDRETNWAAIRQAHGNQIAFVDLTFTGTMLNNLGVIKTEIINGKYVTTIGGFTEEVRKKLEYNAIRYGDFYKLIPEHEKLISDFIHKRTVEVHQKYLGK